MRVLLVVGAALLLAVPGAAKGGPAPFSLRLTWAQFDTVIEQESPNFRAYNCPVTHDPACDPSLWVTRSQALAGCFWDADDHATWAMPTNRATLAAGESYTLATCVVGNDPAYMTWAQFFGLSVVSSSGSLDVSIAINPGAGPYTHRLSAVRIGNDWEYRGCLGGPVYDSSVAPALPDTNGGSGTIATVAMTITNPSGRSARITNAAALVAQGDYYFQSSSGGFRFNGGYQNYCRHDNPMSVWRPLAPAAFDPVYYSDSP